MMQGEDPERALALSYAVPARRDGLEALLALDATLGQILRTTREPVVGQMRLTWWYDALTALDSAAPPAQPVLQRLAVAVLPHDVTGARLAGMIDGWEALLDPDPLDRARLDAYATQRGAALFEMAGQVLGADARDPLARAGAGWALADLAGHMRNADEAALPRLMAAEALGEATRQRWSRAGRALGALAHSARMSLVLPVGHVPPIGAPRRIARLAFHRLSGR